jgi:hypothetical protein
MFESLKREKYFFLNDVGEYSNKPQQDKNKLFLQKIETLLMSESEMGTEKKEKVEEKGKTPIEQQ